MKIILSSIAIALAFGALSAHADVILYAVVDTHTLAGTTGYVDFQFNPGPLTTQSASLKIENFAGATYVAGSQVDTGGASGGPLPSTVTLNNSTSYNDDYESVKFGNTLTFALDFGGNAINAPNGTAVSGSSFAFSLSDAGGNPLLTNDPNGFDAVVNINTKGMVSYTLPSPSVTFAPEPTSWLMMGGGAFALLGLKLRSRS